MLKKMKSAFNVKARKVIQRQDTINRDDIMKALTLLDEQIQTNRPDLEEGTLDIIVAGGATSVLLLGNRTETKDIDYYHHDADVIEAISNFKATLDKEVLKHFPRMWINADMTAFVNNVPGCERFYEESKGQREIIFQGKKLHVYAADWRFQLVNKIARAYMIIQDGGYDLNQKDLSDAIHIMHSKFNVTQERLRLSEIKGWYFNGPALYDEEVDLVNRAYCEYFETVIPPISKSS